MAACRMCTYYDNHKPVLLTEAVENLITKPDGIYIDATFGRGNHTQAILARLNAEGRLIGFDKDVDAVRYAKSQINDPRFLIIHASYADLLNALAQNNIHQPISGILFDLGISSPQLDNPERGFSFMHDGPLDMRMNMEAGLSASDWLACVSESELANVLWSYGEERYARRIARAIVDVRSSTQITRTSQLAQIIQEVVPRAKMQTKHPATRSFQAIRIAINNELEELRNGLSHALELLTVSGRMVIISFHSLEDRIVKQFIRTNALAPELPRALPLKDSQIQFKPRLKSLARLHPSEDEIKANPRSRSAILRVAEKQS